MPSGGGSVTLSPSGGVYDSGTVVTLTASPTSEYNFLHWIDGNSIWTWTSLTVTMTGNKSIIAYFEVKKSKFTLTTSVQPTGGGSISLSPSGGTYDSGTVVTLTASPASGYNFSNWSGSATGTSTSATVTMTGNKSVTANFAVHVLPRYTLTTAVLPIGSGSISLSPSGGTYDSGTVVNLTALPASGYNFSSWSGSVTGTVTSTSVPMTGNKSVTAVFIATTGNLLIINGCSTKKIDFISMSPHGTSSWSNNLCTATMSPSAQQLIFGIPPGQWDVQVATPAYNVSTPVGTVQTKYYSYSNVNGIAITAGDTIKLTPNNASFTGSLCVTNEDAIFSINQIGIRQTGTVNWTTIFNSVLNPGGSVVQHMLAPGSYDVAIVWNSVNVTNTTVSITSLQTTVW
jgi:hypothetical protein